MATGGDRRLAATARNLLAMGGGLESTAGGVQIDGKRLRDEIEREVRRNAAADGTTSETTVVDAVSEVLVNGARALERAEADDTAPNLSDLERASLEAIVHVVGRPALRLCNGSVEMPADLGGNDRWRVIIATARSKVKGVCAGVGRVVRGTGGAAEVLGTAWRVGKDLVVTNRHVAAGLVADSARPAEEWTLAAATPGFVEFGADACAAARRTYPLTALVYCEPDAGLDLAVLRLQSPAGALPAALEIRWSEDGVGRPVPDGSGGRSFKGEEVYVIGHPQRTYPSDAVRLVFGAADGTTRCSPGLVTNLADDKPRFEHDCSTLGGNSGSCVVSVRWHEAVGLHYGALGADDLTARASANVAIAFCALAAHPAGVRLSALSTT